jgi:hypothetical protein
MKIVSAAIGLSICLAGSGSNSRAEEPGLVGHWTFDEGQGEIAKDSSGKGNDGRIHHATWTEGKSGNALSFNGKDAYVNCGNDNSLDLLQAFTIEAWVLPRSGGRPEQSIVGKGYKYDANYLLRMGIPWVANRLMLKVADQRTQGAEIGYDRWHHVAGVCDGERIAIYIDGELASERPFFRGLRVNSISVTIGRALGAPDGREYFCGIIDDVKIHDRVLSKYGLKGPTGAEVGRKTRDITSRGAWGDYEGFPGVCRLADGDLIVVFYAGTSHMGYPHPSTPKNGRICFMRSRDSGKQWSTPKTLFDSDWDDRDPGIAQLKDGTIICSFSRATWYERGRVEEVCTVRSFDGGETWESVPATITAPWYSEDEKQEVIRTAGPRAASDPIAMDIEAVCASNSPVRELLDGTLILPCYGFFGTYRKGIHYSSGLVRSENKGKTWGDPTIVAPSSPADLCEPDIVELEDKRLLRGQRPDMDRSRRTGPVHPGTCAVSPEDPKRRDPLRISRAAHSEDQRHRLRGQWPNVEQALVDRLRGRCLPEPGGVRRWKDPVHLLQRRDTQHPASRLRACVGSKARYPPGRIDP